MTIQLSTPSAIYETINDELTKIVTSLDLKPEDPTLKDVTESTHQQLEQLQHNLQQQLSALQSNTEWNTFTIAFYGETGAGKSTVIETLRILLKEPTKLAQQATFRSKKHDYERRQEEFAQQQQQLSALDTQLSELKQQLDTNEQQHLQQHDQAVQAFQRTESALQQKAQTQQQRLTDKDRPLRALQTQIEQLTAAIDTKKQQASWWQKLLHLLRGLPEEKQLAELERKEPPLRAERDELQQQLSALHTLLEDARKEKTQQLTHIREHHQQIQQKLLSQQQQAEQKQQALTLEQKQLSCTLQQQLDELEACADGDIIGNGSSDFTRQTQSYDFEVNGQTFALLDVPGIEGKEGQVIEEIEKAVQTAHAVFYVTNKPTPPQTGDNERKGTLEKIKQHLGAQTEVWSVFNKKITNPKLTLKDHPLLSDEEKSTLLTLEDTMREQLGDNFQRAIPLTALPAFHAATDCLVPDSKHAKRRQKCLQTFTEHELLEVSLMQNFIDMLNNQLLPRSSDKITRSNFHKAKVALDGTTTELDTIEETFTELADSIKETSDSSRFQLSSSFSALQERLKSRSESLVKKLAQKVRQQCYDIIEKDISNDRFKRTFEAAIEEQQTWLNQTLPTLMEEQVQQFEHEAADILQRFEEQTQELSTLSEKLGNTKLNGNFDLQIKIDNGINVKALIASIAGGALSIPLTGGASIAVIIASVASALLAVGKAVFSFFSSDYKMSQQRKATDENLSNIVKQLNHDLHDALNDTMPEMEQLVDEIDAALEAPVKQTKQSLNLMYYANLKLKALSKDVNALGVL